MKENKTYSEEIFYCDDAPYKGTRRTVIVVGTAIESGKEDNCNYFWLAVTDTSLVVVRYCRMAAKDGLSLGVTSQHCIIRRYRSGGQASGRERR